MRDITELEELHQIETDILTAIDEICRKENIRYYLAGGTLLGAVRHKGFIPWDDDIDIAMPRDDYERFLKVMRKGAHPYYKFWRWSIRRIILTRLPKWWIQEPGFRKRSEKTFLRWAFLLIFSRWMVWEMTGIKR